MPISAVVPVQSALALTASQGGGVDAVIEAIFAPIARLMSRVIFFAVPVGEARLELIVVWLVVGAVFFTLYFRFVNLSGFLEAIRLVRGSDQDPDNPGEVSHFEALATAVSGTVGVGNIAHVAIAISVGGPGAAFWIAVAGFLGMSSKFVECTLGVKYRRENPDGSVSGGPMYYIDEGLSRLGLPRLGRGLAMYYAVCIVVGCLGVGCMFQSNQAFVQFLNVTGGESSPFHGRGWLFGVLLAVLVGAVIVGGIKSIARVTVKLVPLMALLYLGLAAVVILANADELPRAFRAILVGAFSPEGVRGGAIGVLILGFRRAAFSNEAGIGSASIAHSAVKTKEPITEGLVAVLEPFIDTVVVCSVTALVITVTVWDPNAGEATLSGVELTSQAMASVVSWFPYPLAVVVMLFAFSTMISWAYYGLQGFIYLVGPSARAKLFFNLLFCVFVVIGCAIQLQSVLNFSDAMVFAMALANVFALYLLAPEVKADLKAYWAKRR